MHNRDGGTGDGTSCTNHHSQSLRRVRTSALLTKTSSQQNAKTHGASQSSIHLWHAPMQDVQVSALPSQNRSCQGRCQRGGGNSCKRCGLAGACCGPQALLSGSLSRHMTQPRVAGSCAMLSAPWASRNAKQNVPQPGNWVNWAVEMAAHGWTHPNTLSPHTTQLKQWKPGKYTAC